jgi:hypothetical protein
MYTLTHMPPSPPFLRHLAHHTYLRKMSHSKHCAKACIADLHNSDDAFTIIIIEIALNSLLLSTSFVHITATAR